jgi:type IV pilus assembly protein PilM
MIDALVEAVLGAKLDPVGIDLSPFALVRAVGTQDGALEVEQAGNEAIIDVGAHVTVVCVHDRGVTRFVRILPTGGRDLTLALARALGVEEDVAEQLKRGIEVDGAPGREDVRRIVATRLAAFVDEVRSSLEFYAAQVSGARIARVLAVGGGSKLEGFMEALEQRIPVPVDRGRLLDRVKSELDQTPEAVSEIEPVLPVAVGLAISGRRRS